MNAARRLRIDIVSGSYPPAVDGLADYTRQVALALRARGHDVAVHTRTPGPPEPGLERGFGCRGSRDLRALLLRIAVRSPDVVHLHHQTARYDHGLAMAAFGDLASELVPDARLVVTLHDLEAPRPIPWMAWSRPAALRRLARHASGVVVTSEVDQEGVLSWGLARERVCLVPVGPSMTPSAEHVMARAAVRESLGVAPGETIFVQFGLLARDKGIATTIEAARLLPPGGWRLVLIATPRTSGERRLGDTLRRLAAGLGVDDGIIWRQSLAPSEVSRHLAASDVGLLPYDDGLTTRRSTFAVLAAHGLAIVTTRPRIWPRVFGPESPALFVAPRNPAALSRAMRDLLPASPAREDLQRRALACAKKLSWEECARKLEMLYRQAEEVSTR